MTDYIYTPAILKELESAISIPRLSTYFTASNGNLQKSIELHAWNTELASALFVQILNIELLVRNKCCYQLGDLFKRIDWYNALPATDSYYYLRNQIEIAQNKLYRLGKNSNYPPQIAANLTFGFWVALFEKHLHRDLWAAGLHKIFNYPPPNFNRHEAWERLREIRDMRNRIAHHEPIFDRDLLSFETRLLNLAGYMSPEFAAWMKHHSRLEQVCKDGY